MYVNVYETNAPHLPFLPVSYPMLFPDQTLAAPGGLVIEFARLAPREALGVPPGVLRGSPNMR
jgi:hypothetical protein